MSYLARELVGSFEPRCRGMGTLRFKCVVCEETKVYSFWRGDDRFRALPPICGWCENSLKGPRPTAGAFHDRRLATRLFAMAEALYIEALRMEWSRAYGKA
jgi:hypothetical protein